MLFLLLVVMYLRCRAFESWLSFYLSLFVLHTFAYYLLVLEHWIRLYYVVVVVVVLCCVVELLVQSFKKCYDVDLFFNGIDQFKA